jgi:hypothetical protein
MEALRNLMISNNKPQSIREDMKNCVVLWCVRERAKHEELDEHGGEFQLFLKRSLNIKWFVICEIVV